MSELEKGIQLYTDGVSLLQAWKESGCGRNKLQEALKERGLTRSNKQNSRKYTMNHSFFEIIDTEAKAYWLGFIYADGYVSKRENGQKSVGIALGRKDKEHLKKFLHAIDATYDVKDYEGNSYGKTILYSRVWMTSEKMFDDLVSKGVTEHKTLTLKFPTKEIVPDRLLHHFVRGYFDGDGSFAFDGKSHYRIKIEGTQEFLTSLAWAFGQWIDEDHFYRRHKDKDTSRTFELAKIQDVKDAADYMYKDANIYLTRKYERYLKV